MKKDGQDILKRLAVQLIILKTSKKLSCMLLCNFMVPSVCIRNASLLAIEFCQSTHPSLFLNKSSALAITLYAPSRKGFGSTDSATCNM